MSYKVLYSCISHVGKKRSMNQDNYFCDGRFMSAGKQDFAAPVDGEIVSAKPTVLGVFDGMGGEECGEIAAYLAAKAVSQIIYTGDSVNDLATYCKNANKLICDYTVLNSLSSMGTTAAMLLFKGEEITLCNIGDSRIFRISKGEITQISEDHVAISAFGTKPPLTQSLGIPEDELIIEPYFSKGILNKDDKYVICSDGLTDMVGNDVIKQIVTDNTPDKATRLLVNKALENGGKDNVTVIVAQVKKKSIFGR